VPYDGKRDGMSKSSIPNKDEIREIIVKAIDSYPNKSADKKMYQNQLPKAFKSIGFNYKSTGHKKLSDFLMEYSDTVEVSIRTLENGKQEQYVRLLTDKPASDISPQTRMPSRKAFLSFLGTGPYVECIYTLKDNERKTRFVQDAMVRMLCNNFTEKDKIFFFLTEEAKTQRWEKYLQKNTLPEPGLKEIIHATVESLPYSPKVIPIDIPSGKDEDEIWGIFNKVYEVLNEDDIITLDITHAFRSLPMLCFTILNYARYLKNISVRGIFYGAYEAREGDKAPIFELTSFFELMQWTSAADTFINYGISDKIQRVVRETLPMPPDKTLTETIRHNALAEKVADSITKVTESMTLLRGADIINGKIFSFCLDDIDELEKSANYQTAFKPVFDKVREKVKLFRHNDPLNFLLAVRWYLDHKMIPQALTMMQEGLITFILVRKNRKFDDYINRNCAKAFLVTKGEPRDKYKPLLIKWRWNRKDHFFIDVSNIYKSVRDLRNDVNHGGFEKGSKNYLVFNNDIEALFIRLQNYVNNN
jgi:CRISPR-associated Csx2 family protein